MLHRVPPNQQRGFTLVEILVVVAIIGVLSALVLVSIGTRDTDRKLQADAERLMLVIEQARRASVSRQEVWGMQQDGESYLFQRLDETSSEWVDIEDRPFAREPLRNTVSMAVQSEGLTPSSPSSRDLAPQVVVLPNGELSPFSIRLVDEASDDVWIVESDGLSQTEAFKIELDEESE